MPQFRPVQFGKYLLLERVATGGMAEVFKAKQTGEEGFEKIVIIKTLFPHLQTEKELVQAFIEEAKLAARLQHPNVVQIYDFGKVDDSYFIAMEYLDGVNLRAVLDAGGKYPLGLENALFITQQLCAGLNYAHNMTDNEGNSLCLIHRDVSPPNIILTREGQLKVIDFGIAKAASQNTSTQLGIIKGKVAYMSPEQARGEMIDHRSDIFSIGILLYEMVTGRKLYQGDTVAILALAREAEFEPAGRVQPDLPGQVADIIHRALQKNIRSRYQSAADMMDDVDDCMSVLGLRPANHRLAAFLEQIVGEKQQMQATTAGRADSSGRETGRSDFQPVQEQMITEDPGDFEKTVEIDMAEENTGVGNKRMVIGAAVMAVLIAAAGFFTVRPWFDKRSDPPPAVSEFRTDDAAAGPADAAGKEPDSLFTPEDNGPSGLYPQTEEHPQPAAVTDPDPVPISEAVTDDGPPPVPDPGRFPDKLAQAVESLDLKFFTEAAVQFEALLDTFPEKRQTIIPYYVKSLLGKASALAGKKDFSSAEKIYRKAILADEACVDAAFNLGYIYAVKKEYAKAETMYQKAVDLEPPYLDEALFNLSVVQDKLGKKELVAFNLTRALNINPRNTRVEKYLERFKQKNRE